mgnify:CR=1 FL=1
MQLINKILNRSLDAHVPGMYDEAMKVFEEVIPLKGQGPSKAADLGVDLLIVDQIGLHSRLSRQSTTLLPG